MVRLFLPPKRISQEARNRLKENAIPFEEFREPYNITFTANITEKTLPVVKATIRLMGIDGSFEDKTQELNSVDMLWDTGAHQTIISNELLSEEFRSYLQDPIHDPYRSPNCLRVQAESVIALANALVEIPAIVLVVSKSVMPNGRIGVIFGQQHCIDHMNYTSIPRRILELKGVKIEEDVWGDFVTRDSKQG